MSRPAVFLAHPSSLDHDPGPHPEQPARITAIERELADRDWLGYQREQSPEVDRDVLQAVHPARYVESLEALCARGGGALDLDTAVSRGSFAAALHAAGGAVRLAELLVRDEAPTGFSAHRPPGHHALASRAMGFCLFNNVAVAAQYALDALGLERVMIVDWDVHHGNGTEAIFAESAQVLFVSIHQWPLYPGTGPASEVGSGRGEGFTVNLPVPAGSGDGEYQALVDGVVVPLARAFQPQLMLLSAGYDAHADDPLAGCRVTEAGFAAMARTLRAVASEVDAPVGAVLEGGYALAPLARSVAATMAGLAGEPDGRKPVAAADSELVARARERLRPWWEL